MRTTTLASVLLGAVISMALAAPQNAATHSSAAAQTAATPDSAEVIAATPTSASAEDVATQTSPAQSTVTELTDKKKKDIVKVAYGQQIQEEDQTNHWVIWIEGKSACPPLATLSSLIEDPCGQKFSLPGSDQLEFAGCDDDGEPHVLLSAGKFVRTCKSYKTNANIHCPGKDHDVVKHGKCVEQ
ncbi:hypothetical protein GGR51DRAFT_520727 [Nemania sp. FL0031]|nr:hypothetical protein GGR51DRAFT_520727 [Nemania sp. FL0031]